VDAPGGVVARTKRRRIRMGRTPLEVVTAGEGGRGRSRSYAAPDTGASTESPISALQTAKISENP
jgi:hypothetical protein